MQGSQKGGGHEPMQMIKMKRTLKVKALMKRTPENTKDSLKSRPERKWEKRRKHGCASKNKRRSNNKPARTMRRTRSIGNEKNSGRRNKSRSAWRKSSIWKKLPSRIESESNKSTTNGK
jgi:hypothetical protein